MRREWLSGTTISDVVGEWVDKNAEPFRTLRSLRLCGEIFVRLMLVKTALSFPER